MINVLSPVLAMSSLQSASSIALNLGEFLLCCNKKFILIDLYLMCHDFYVLEYLST